MDYFHYRDNLLHCEEVSLPAIAAAVGTPCYCYSRRTIARHYEDAFSRAFAGSQHLICYSVKANSNLAILDTLVRMGAGLDVVSGGELTRARRVNCPGERVVFSGVGKSAAEIRQALEYGILMFNVESQGELHRINSLARELGVRAPIALRVNPAVDPKTHHYIATGLKKSKFGIPHTQALGLYREAARLPGIEIVGLDCHVGSQLTSLDPFVETVRVVRGLLEQLLAAGFAIRYLDLGGGLGIPYDDDQAPPHPTRYAAALLEELAGCEVTLVLEPGRVIVGNAGVLLTRVEYVKTGEEKSFIITDAGMNDLMRPALYDAHHAILPVERKFNRPEMVADIVGPICESGDFFAHDRLIATVHSGELLAIRSAGAYGFSMSSNYNSRPRAAEVMVSGNRFAVVRRRETIEEMLAGESLFDE